MDWNKNKEKYNQICKEGKRLELLKEFNIPQLTFIKTICRRYTEYNIYWNNYLIKHACIFTDTDNKTYFVMGCDGLGVSFDIEDIDKLNYKDFRFTCSIDQEESFLANMLLEEEIELYEEENGRR